MALLFMDGFDTYAAAGAANTQPQLATRGYSQYNGAGSLAQVALSTTTGRFGGGSMSIQAYDQSTSYPEAITKGMTVTSTATYSIGASVNVPALPASATIYLMSAPNATGPLAAFVGLTSTGALALLQPDALGTTLATSTATMTAGAWHHIEAIMQFSTSGTAVSKLYLDGALVLTYTGATLSSTANLPTSLGLCRGYTTGSGGTGGIVGTLFDDLVIADNTGTAVNTLPLGPTRIGTLKPTSDVSKGFTPSSGTANYAMVNGDWTNTTNNVSDTGTGTIDMYGVNSLGWTPGTIFVVQAVAMAQTPSGTRSLYLRAKLGATTLVSAMNTLAIGNYSAYSNAWYVDSAGGALTAATINAMNLGISD